MGNVILPNGTSVFVQEADGSINLSQLIEDMNNKDYTPKYRIAVVKAVGKLGRNAITVLPELRGLVRDKSTDVLLREAAEASIKSIEEINKHHNYNDFDNYGPTTPTPKKVELTNVLITEIESSLREGVKVYNTCNFCEKTLIVSPYYKEFSDRLSPDDKFYCNFCVRNDYYQKSGNNILVISYRGLIGYYYHCFFLASKTSTMLLMDIHDYVELHIKVGMQNPLFRYDPETMCWFIDFSKVGKSKKKIPLTSVLQTVIQQLACFNIYENVRGSSPSKFYAKFADVINSFADSRKKTSKVFTPTLWDCGIPTKCPAGTKPIPVEVLQNFLSSSLVEQHKRKVSY